MAITWGKLTDLIENGKALTINGALFFVFSQQENQLFALELNTGAPNNDEFGQLFLHGVDAKGVRLDQIGGEYAPFTKDIKVFEGLPIDRITLYQEGEFYRSFDFIQKQDSFIIRANTIKEGEDLRDRWGANILGLNNESLNILANEVLPQIIQYILRELLS